MPESPGDAHEKLTHLDAAGRPRMVDVSAKPDTQREAVAKGEVLMRPETFAAVRHGTVAKGDVLAAAQIAGIMAAKRTWEIIPMCHPLLLTGIQIEFELDEPRHVVKIRSIVRTTGKTGVEMEALTATSVAALTIYDMCKAIDKTMQIGGLSLVRKSGGKSGTFVVEEQ